MSIYGGDVVKVSRHDLVLGEYPVERYVVLKVGQQVEGYVNRRVFFNTVVLKV